MDITTIQERLLNIFEGDVDNSTKVLKEYSRDTSIFEVIPQLVVFPKHQKDLENLVQTVNELNQSGANLSLTGRSAGTDMTGGPLNESIIVSFTKYFDHQKVDIDNLTAVIEPGVYYRDFEKNTLPQGISLPCYPASKNLAALGGLVMNNSAGERTLKYGQTREFVNWVEITLSDGNTHQFGPLNSDELKTKLELRTFEGSVYKQLYQLVMDNWEIIKNAEPIVSKNSAGYALWRVWDPETQIFNLAHLFVGSQGTLGLLNRAELRLVTEPQHRRMVVIFLKDWQALPKTVNLIREFGPEEIEVFDDQTMWLGIRFMPQIAKLAGTSLFKFALQFLPEIGIGIRMLRMPKLVLIVEFADDNQEQLNSNIDNLTSCLKQDKVLFRSIDNENSRDDEKYWTMRRESFALLRKSVGDKHTAPFVEDFCVRPELLPEFLPKAMKLLRNNGIKATIAGHAGDGNLHIIPLMNLHDPIERAKIVPVATEFYKLVAEYGGSITAEHNDGILRTPFLETMYGGEVVNLFKEVKKILDPNNIFNPGKKVGGSLEYLENHISAFED